MIIRAPAAVITVVCGLCACTTANQDPVSQMSDTAATVNKAMTTPTPAALTLTDGSHHAVLYERYQSAPTPAGPIILDVSVYESNELPGAFVVRLTHIGDYDDDFWNVRVVFDSPSAPTDGWTEANGASMNLLSSSQFEVLAHHIARTMTIEVRLGTAHGSVFHIAEVWQNSVQLSLTQ